MFNVGAILRERLLHFAATILIIELLYIHRVCTSPNLWFRNNRWRLCWTTTMKESHSYKKKCEMHHQRFIIIIWHYSHLSQIVFAACNLFSVVVLIAVRYGFSIFVGSCEQVLWLWTLVLSSFFSLSVFHWMHFVQFFLLSSSCCYWCSWSSRTAKRLMWRLQFYEHRLSWSPWDRYVVFVLIFYTMLFMSCNNF